MSDQQLSDGAKKTRRRRHKRRNGWAATGDSGVDNGHVGQSAVQNEPDRNNGSQVEGAVGGGDQERRVKWWKHEFRYHKIKGPVATTITGGYNSSYPWDSDSYGTVVSWMSDEQKSNITRYLKTRDKDGYLVAKEQLAEEAVGRTVPSNGEYCDNYFEFWNRFMRDSGFRRTELYSCSRGGKMFLNRMLDCATFEPKVTPKYEGNVRLRIRNHIGIPNIITVFDLRRLPKRVRSLLSSGTYARIVSYNGSITGNFREAEQVNLNYMNLFAIEVYQVPFEGLLYEIWATSGLCKVEVDMDVIPKPRFVKLPSPFVVRLIDEATAIEEAISRPQPRSIHTRMLQHKVVAEYGY